MDRIPVVVESPYAAGPNGTVAQNLDYLDECLSWCIEEGYSPYASHGLLTRVLRDTLPQQRWAGIEAGYVFHDALGLVIFFIDLGMSPGMKLALDRCARKGTECRLIRIRERTT